MWKKNKVESKEQEGRVWGRGLWLVWEQCKTVTLYMKRMGWEKKGQKTHIKKETYV